MKNHRHYAKETLLNSTTSEYEKLIEESNISNEEKSIAFLKLIQDESYVTLSFKYHCSPEHIRDVMSKVYDKVYRVIKRGGLI